MRGVCAALLTFEAVVLMLFAPVAAALTDLSAPVAAAIGLGLAALCLVTAALLRRPWAYHLGTALQVVAVLLGFVVPAMFLLGAAFGGLWLVALRLGRQVEAREAARRGGDVPPEAATDAG